MGGLIYSKTYQVSVHMSLQPFASNRSPMNKKYNAVLLLSLPLPLRSRGGLPSPKGEQKGTQCQKAKLSRANNSK